MIVLSNSAKQSLAPGQSIVFDLEVFRSGNTECHRDGSSAVSLKCAGVYAVGFHGNITSTVAGPVQLGILFDGEVLPETTMISTPSTVGNVNNVGTETLVKNCCGCAKVTVTNTGTSTVVINPNTALVISKK